MKLAAIAALLAVTATASAETTYVSKKDKERATKSTKHGAVPAPGTKPKKLINLYNEHTKDWLAVDDDVVDPPTGVMIDTFLRDHFTNEKTKMDPKLIGTVVSAAQQFKSDIVNVVSGFRHPKYNLMLRKKGHQVARDSQHTHGNAIDFSIPTCSTKQLEKWAKDQKIGGVGVYMESGFIHMDTGPIRSWDGE
ncbi:MAG TPA: DUF882 domain-containing protein [Kofleriaceae bacterium]|nr:DUF882 domain-containing protein [Kofleriaceae bacterium]